MVKQRSEGGGQERGGGGQVSTPLVIAIDAWGGWTQVRTCLKRMNCSRRQHPILRLT